MLYVNFHKLQFFAISIQKMISFGSSGPMRNIVFCVYVIVQALTIATLIISGINVILHIIFMVLATTFYFIVSCKNPGYFDGEQIAIQPHQPQEQVKAIQKNIFPQLNKIQEENSHVNSQNNSVSGTANKDKYESDVYVKENQDKQNNDLNIQSSIKQNNTDLKYGSIQGDINQEKQNCVGNKKSQKNVGGSCMNICNLSQGIQFQEEKLFSDIKQYRIEDIPTNARKCNKKKSLQQDIFNQIKKNIAEKKNNKSIEKPKPIQKSQQTQLISLPEKSPQASLPQNILQISAQLKQNADLIAKLNTIKRFCRICQIDQPLRVRHCHECERCVSSFDHHCPWMNNCIGQKNKHFFIIYLFTQSLQLWTIVIDVIRFLVVQHNAQNFISLVRQLSILLIVLVFFSVVMLILLIFQSYFISININTWEYMRWEKIQYLQIFDRKVIKSLFHRGCAINVASVFNAARMVERKHWEEDLNENAYQNIKTKQIGMKDQLQMPNYEGVLTNRRLVKSSKNVSVKQFNSD